MCACGLGSTNESTSKAHILKVRGSFLRGLGDKAAVGGEGVGSGKESQIMAVVVNHDKVIPITEVQA